MGKGDKKTRRGKITLGTFGVRRRRKKANKPAVKMAPPATEKELKEKPVKEKKAVKEVREKVEIKEAKEVDVTTEITEPAGSEELKPSKSTRTKETKKPATEKKSLKKDAGKEEADNSEDEKKPAVKEEKPAKVARPRKQS